MAAIIGKAIPPQRQRTLDALALREPDRVDAFMAHYDATGHDDSTIIIRPTRVIQYRGG